MVTEEERMDILNALAEKKRIQTCLLLADRFTETKMTAEALVNQQITMAQKIRADAEALRRQAEGYKQAFKKRS